MSVRHDESLAKLLEEESGIAEWARRLRANCEMLCHAPEEVIRSLSLSWTVRDGPVEVQAIARLARDLADEYGLAASVEPRGRRLLVKYSRPGAGSARRD